MFISSRDGFVTNTKQDCERTLRRKERRAERRVFGNPYISGPVYTYRKPEPTREAAPEVSLKSSYTSGPVYVQCRPEKEPIRPFAPKPLAEKEKGEGLLSKIGAFFTAVAGSIAEAQEAELTPNVYMSEGDMLILQSMEESAVEFDSEEEAKEALKAARKPHQSKQSIRRAKKLAEKQAAEAERAAQQPSILDIKDEVEAEARRLNEKAEKEARMHENNREELLLRLSKFMEAMPEVGAYKYISEEYISELDNNELVSLLDEIQKAKLTEHFERQPVNKERWDMLEEYMLFAKDVNVRRFVQMLDASNVGVLNPAEAKGLADWSSNSASSKADFRYSGDVSHNWCITNLKNAFYETYKMTAEDAGKLDHDPVLNFPNGTKTRLSRFIGDKRFDEIAEKDARGKDFADVKAKDVKIAGVKRKTA